MTAKEYIHRVIREEFWEDASVLALIESGSWWHVHWDEELPTKNTIVIKVGVE